MVATARPATPSSLKNTSRTMASSAALGLKIVVVARSSTPSPLKYSDLMPSFPPRLGLAFALAVLAVAASQACGDRSLPGDEPGSTGGNAAGGARATGGRGSDAGHVNTGGNSTGGGDSSGTGGSTGGYKGSGGCECTGGRGSVGTGGQSSSGGVVATGGVRATGGSATGGAGMMATGGTGGSTCGLCPTPTCNPGYVLRPSSTSCCMVCQPLDCSTVRCADPMCPAGMHAEKSADQCCPSCVAGPVTMACQMARDQYTMYRQSLIEKYRSTGCRTDKDCVLVPEANHCSQGCPLAFPLALASSAKANLNDLPQCADCPAPPIPPCVATVALCSNGQCTEGSPL